MTTELIEIELETMAHGGSALGRQAGRAIFLPYTIPGERVQARIVQEKGRTLFAEGVTLLEASADRVYPRCPHFGPAKCGRCQWQHIAYPAQLLLKQDVLADQLERIGGFSDPQVHPLIPSRETWGYNVHMTLGVNDSGEAGFPQASFDKQPPIFPTSECHLLHPDLLRLKDSLDLESMTGVQQITLRLDSSGATMIVIRTANDQPPELETDLPMSVNLLLSDNQPVNLIGDLYSHYQVSERNFRVTAGSFFQPNLAQVETLVQAVIEALNLTKGQHVLDLYGGVGLFSAFVAPLVEQVTLVESYAPAVRDAQANLADLPNVTLLGETVEAALASLEGSYAVALLDPPGDGLSLEALDRVVALRLPRLVYLSSDPATLARDCKRLAAQGYRLTSVQPLDLAPHTYYIDALAVLEM